MGTQSPRGLRHRASNTQFPSGACDSATSANLENNVDSNSTILSGAQYVVCPLISEGPRTDNS